MQKISRVLQSIKTHEWRKELGEIQYWQFHKLNPVVDSPTCVFTVRATINSNMLPGFEHIYAEWHVDQVDLQRKEFINKSDPESAYIEYIKERFGAFMADSARKVANNAALKAGLILPKHATPQVLDRKHQGQVDKFNNMLYAYRQRKKR